MGSNLETGRQQQQQLNVTMVPEALATPSDIQREQVQAIAQAVNGLVADAFALYIKTKNFHWHLAGVHFRDLHLLFDEQAEAIFASIDLLAERVRRIGGTTIRSVGQIAELTSIADDNEAYVSAPDMVARLMDDNRKMVAAMRAAHDVCDQGRDMGTASILETLIDETERRVWFLFEVHQGMQAT